MTYSLPSPGTDLFIPECDVVIWGCRAHIAPPIGSCMLSAGELLLHHAQLGTICDVSCPVAIVLLLGDLNRSRVLKTFSIRYEIMQMRHTRCTISI